MASCLLRGIVAIEGLEGDSNRRFREYSSTLSRGSVGFPKRRLFLQFHKFHNTMVMSSGSFVPAKTKSIKSIKQGLRISWFHDGVLFQRFYNPGHR